MKMVKGNVGPAMAPSGPCNPSKWCGAAEFGFPSLLWDSRGLVNK